MYIPIYEPKDKEQKYALRLLVEDGDTILCIVDKETGEMVHNGRLICFTDGGRLFRRANINRGAAEALGITLDDSNCIIIGY